MLMINLDTDWYIEVGERKSGPFTREQVLGLLSEGEIPAQCRVTHANLGDRWISAKDLAEDHLAAPVVGEVPGASRSAETLSLLDTLQAARERRGVLGTPLPPSLAERSEANHGLDAAFKRNALLGVAVVLIGFLSWKYFGAPSPPPLAKPSVKTTDSASKR